MGPDCSRYGVCRKLNQLLRYAILLGVAEAGFFPGIILYLTYWFPARHRAGVIALFMAAAPLPQQLVHQSLPHYLKCMEFGVSLAGNGCSLLKQYPHSS